MSFRFSSFQICRGVAALVLSGLLVCSAQAGGKERGRSIEFSEPKSDEVTTNLHQMTNKKDGLRQLEEDLYKPLQAFAPDSSLDGVVATPPRAPSASVIQSKRVKELLERRRNWEFMSPEDLTAGPTVEGILKVPQYDANGQPQKEISPMERYYQHLAAKRLNGKRTGESKDDELFAPPNKANPRDLLTAPDDADLPPALKEKAQELKRFTEQENSDTPFTQAPIHGTVSDTFGLAASALSKDQLAEHLKLMNEYHAMVDPGWHAPTTPNPASPLTDLPTPLRTGEKPAAGLGASAAPGLRTAVEVERDVLNPALGPAGMPDLNAQALGQPRAAPPLPTVPTPKVIAPTFTAPKRVF